MEFDGIVNSINKGEGFSNITVRLDDDKDINVKVEQYEIDSFEIGKAYHFVTEKRLNKEREQEVLEKYCDVFAFYKGEELAKCLMRFYRSAPINVDDEVKNLEQEIANLKNEVIKTITKEIYNGIKNDFIIYPAATKFHHAYIGGLLYHTITMIKAAKKLLEVYNFLSSDLVIAGIILHDMAKVKEFTSSYNASYSLEGHLIGHLALGTLEIGKVAQRLNIEGKEIMLLEHIVLSHHGYIEYGSPKKPMIPEAVFVSLIDNMDSKMAALGDALIDTKEEEFTIPISVLDRGKIYKHNIK